MSINPPTTGAYEFQSTAPSKLSERDLARCATIVSDGGAVSAEDARRGLARASALVVVRNADDIIAVGALKRALPRYVAGLVTKSGYAIANDAQELGYVAVDPVHRDQHLSTRIVRLLREYHEGGLFATTDEERMKTVLAKVGFQRRGREWKGRRGDLSLWTMD